MRLSMDVKKVAQIQKAIDAKDGYCPCYVGKSEDTKCPCKDMRIHSVCICGKYVDEESK